MRQGSLCDTLYLQLFLPEVVFKYVFISAIVLVTSFKLLSSCKAADKIIITQFNWKRIGKKACQYELGKGHLTVPLKTSLNPNRLPPGLLYEYQFKHFYFLICSVSIQTLLVPLLNDSPWEKTNHNQHINI